MVRSAAAILTLILLPAAAQAQRVHHVTGGETLWTLAQQYYGDPYKWPQVYEANRGVVEDPHWIYPGEDLVIPNIAAEAVVEQVTVVPGQPPAPEPRPVEAGEPERTIFYARDGASAFGTDATFDQTRLVVSRSVSYATPWLGPLDRDPDHSGLVLELTGAEDEHVPRTTALVFDKLELQFDGPVPARGTEIMTFRVGRTLPGIGRVLIPTGVLAVSDPVPGGGVALVVDVFDRLSMGDLFMALPAFNVQPGARAVPTTTGADATLVGFAAERALQNVNDIAFMDQGSDHGVKVGDEYVVVWVEGRGTPPEVEGRLQVVSVHPDHSSARIVSMKNPIFQTGLRVRLDRKMP